MVDHNRINRINPDAIIAIAIGMASAAIMIATIVLTVKVGRMLLGL
jgi:hypothetical protein